MENFSFGAVLGQKWFVQMRIYTFINQNPKD